MSSEGILRNDSKNIDMEPATESYNKQIVSRLGEAVKVANEDQEKDFYKAVFHDLARNFSSEDRGKLLGLDLAGIAWPESITDETIYKIIEKVEGEYEAISAEEKAIAELRQTEDTEITPEVQQQIQILITRKEAFYGQ